MALHANIKHHNVEKIQFPFQVFPPQLFYYPNQFTVASLIHGFSKLFPTSFLLFTTRLIKTEILKFIFSNFINKKERRRRRRRRVKRNKQLKIQSNWNKNSFSCSFTLLGIWTYLEGTVSVHVYLYMKSLLMNAIHFLSFKNLGHTLIWFYSLIKCQYYVSLALRVYARAN